MTAPLVLDGRAPMLLIADHASNRVPPGVDLGVPPALLDTHIAVDIGSAALTRGLAKKLAAPAILATVSRLVIDCNREPGVSGLIPVASDGHIIPGNLALTETERELRVAAIHTPYHGAIASEIERRRSALLVSIHSFTPRLATAPEEVRPWPVAVLHNQDSRAARIAIASLRTLGYSTGDNEPYSGRELNYTMNRHAEANGIPYIGLELRHDGLASAAGIARWAAILAPIIAATQACLTPARTFGH